MDPIKLQLRSNSRSTALFSRNPRQTKTLPSFIAVSIAISLALFVSVYVFLFFSKDSVKYSIIIDGGSTGTRIHVFRYKVDGDKNPAFDFKEGLETLKVNPGLSAYAEDLEGAADSLKELLEFGRRKVPKSQWGETEIRLMATAGMRLLDNEVQEMILEQCRKVLRVSGFKFRDVWASVITGSDEGVYAWVVANYILGTLGGNPLHTTGIIELGGASAQVTFFSSEPMPSEFSRSIKFGNFTYSLYSHSFLHFGQNVAHESLRESLIKGDFSPAAESIHKETFRDPCTPKGYLPESSNLSLGSKAEQSKYVSEFQARGNFSECRSAALMLLQKGKEKCSYDRCYVGSVFMPKLQGKFLATENFFYTSKFFMLRQKGSLSDLIMAGQHFCEEDWSKLKKKHPLLNEEDLLRYCFSSAYIVALLHDSLEIALDDERISFANQVNDIPLDWALGAFIMQSTAHSDVQHTDWITNIINSDSTLFSIIAFSVVLMFAAWSISKWRKPRLKTIYDLEKGRYIVTQYRKQAHIPKFKLKESMSDHLVLYVDRLVRPLPVHPVGSEAGPSTENSVEEKEKDKEVVQGGEEDEGGEEDPLIQAAECRICQEEDSIKNLETPCACNGSLKYAHRKCVQHWCNEKGDIVCEICHQPYQPDYTAPPPRRTEETAIDIGGGWTISGTPLDLRDPRILAIAEAERQFLETGYDDYAASSATGAAFCRSAAVILMALLLLRHAVTVPDADSDDDVSSFFSFFLLRAAGFLLPCYIMAWAISILQQRRQRQEAAALAATQVAFVLQSGQGRGMHFAIASGPAATPHQERV
ncbi:hypothetical protein V6N13_055590 [Hibiscus sabdariffa]|uniref:Uncharacterized protein n=2 Tax=Hibiscus sabdariffa TaxID=183260 RepID=A0ABR2BLW6_9ROSI